MAQNETHYNTILGIKNDTLVVLEYTFEDGNDFKGAVGYTMSPITKSYIDERKSFDYADKYMWQEAVANDSTELGFEDWWEEQVDECYMYDQLFPYDDNSFRDKTERLWEELPDEEREKLEEVFGVMDKDFVTFDCSSCGRCIVDKDDNWQIILDEDLLNKCKELEGVKEAV